MKKLTAAEKKEIIIKLKNEFNTDEVEYSGFNRFVVREQFQVDLASGDITRLYKDRLFDEECNPIPLANEYNSIFWFTSGVAVVCIRENIKFKDTERGKVFSLDRRYGIIDVNGKELLPCIYNSIHISFGEVELTKDGHVKSTQVNTITSGKFDWNEGINLG